MSLRGRALQLLKAESDIRKWHHRGQEVTSPWPLCRPVRCAVPPVLPLPGQQGHTVPDAACAHFLSPTLSPAEGDGGASCQAGVGLAGHASRGRVLAGALAIIYANPCNLCQCMQILDNWCKRPQIFLNKNANLCKWAQFHTQTCPAC